MSRHLADWYANSLGMLKLAASYNEIYRLIKYQTYSTLRLQAESPAKFTFVHSLDDAKTAISTIRWVVAKMREANDVIHIDIPNLVMIGFMWSLTTLEHAEWDDNAINRFFAPEVYNFEVFVSERQIDIQSLWSKYQRRESTNYNDRIYVRDGKSGGNDYG
jgi:Pyruvate/2-oxoacid:ferredoxin oxidoreductase gamma subunit